ncbi:MAG: tetratricopeptide repeat protein [Pseudolabrys sp.]
MQQAALNLPPALDRVIAEYKAEKFAAAERLCEEIVADQPDFFEALYVLAIVQARQEKTEFALANFDRALALRPDYAVGHFNRGNTLQRIKRHEEALASYERAIELQPDFAMAHSNRGNIQQILGRFEMAMASYAKAIELQPDYAVAYYNRGNCLQQLKRFVEAVASYEQALALQPDFAPARLNQSLSRLVTGDFEPGWRGYEWRLDVESPGNSKRSFARPQWTGRQDISGKTIYLHAEQGLGDAILLCRYVPLIAARGARVVLEVSMPLVELMTTLAGSPQVIYRTDGPADYDLQCPLPSLPLAFGTRLATIPADVPYLRATPERVAQWRDRLGPKHRPRIGLAWSGEPTHPNDQNRSIALHALLPLLQTDATFVSLQKGVRAADAADLQARSDLVHFGDELKNFADTAALVANLDLVISIDSSVAHLAGALAKPVWVLLPYIPDWRWLLDRDDSPWYPTARLFRQDDSRAWPNVLGRLQSALGELAQSRA